MIEGRRDGRAERARDGCCRAGSTRGGMRDEGLTRRTNQHGTPNIQIYSSFVIRHSSYPDSPAATRTSTPRRRSPHSTTPPCRRSEPGILPDLCGHVRRQSSRLVAEDERHPAPPQPFAPQLTRVRIGADRPKAAALQPGEQTRDVFRADTGTLNSDPMLPRKVFGSNGSTHGSIRMIAAAPTASAVRISVPRLPGSCSRSSTSTSSRPVSLRSARDASGMWKVATMPCGSSRSDSAAITLGATGSSSPPPGEAGDQRLRFGTGELRRAKEDLVGRRAGVERHVQQLQAFNQEARAGLAILALA